MVRTSRVMTVLILWLILIGAAALSPAQEGEVWVLIDTERRTLSILQGDETRRVYENISIGRGGASVDKRRNDKKTPLGEFHVSRIAPDTPFHRFFGLDYPNLDQAYRALKDGVITRRQFDRIVAALKVGRAPPQDTPLGGYIGIHGVGEGDPEIHQAFNWTNGCVALSNKQVDDLAKWVQIGTRVVVR